MQDDFDFFVSFLLVEKMEKFYSWFFVQRRDRCARKEHERIVASRRRRLVSSQS